MGLIAHKGILYGGGSDVVPNPQDAATDELEKLGIDGDVYEVTDADYRSTQHTFTTTGYDSSTHKFEGSEMSMSYAVKSIFSPLATVYDAIKTAINDHAGVFTTINTAISSLTTALSGKVDKDSVTFKDLTSSGHRFGIDLSIVSQFTGSNDVSHENTNLTAIKAVVNNLADYTEENVQVESLSDTTPYLYRKSPAIGTRVMENALVGASVVVNQLVNPSDYAVVSTNGITWTKNNEKVTATGSASSNAVYKFINLEKTVYNHIYFICGCPKNGNNSSYYIRFTGTNNYYEYGNGLIFRNENQASSSEYLRAYISSGYSISGSIEFKPQLIDLTEYFGTTIADAAYTKEQSTAGSGIAWLKDNGFDFSEYIAYNTGELCSVNPSAKKVVGFNVWDEEWEVGDISTSTGQNISGQQIRSKNYISVLSNETYCFTDKRIAAEPFRIFEYDNNKNFITQNLYNTASYIKTFSVSNNCTYIRFIIGTGYGIVYNNNVCINISKPTGTPKNGDYVPYEERTYDISNIDLRGIPKLVNNELVYDGDTYESDGNVTRKYGIVDLGTLNWSYNSVRFYSNIVSLLKPVSSNTIIANIRCPKYTPTYVYLQTDRDDKTIGISNDGRVYIYDTAYSDSSTFTTAMSGVYLIYELATPTTEQLAPFDNPQISIVGGTEEYITETDVPVGHESEYKKLPPLFEDDYIQYLQNKVEAGNPWKKQYRISNGYAIPNYNEIERLYTDMVLILQNGYNYVGSAFYPAIYGVPLYVGGTYSASGWVANDGTVSLTNASYMHVYLR